MYGFLEETVQHNMRRCASAVAPEMTVGDLLHLFTTMVVGEYPVESNSWSGSSREPMH
ncbi:hypothetical protein [Bradyrhizobium genosp. P]|uniref:hypothetical protein n=1 Tax=Bradyrhizobium genosp. P TaxID=83641 RepID=UPI003CF78B0D